LILIDDIEVIDFQPSTADNNYSRGHTELFIPRQSRLTIKSINTEQNTLQDRGVTMLGWYL